MLTLKEPRLLQAVTLEEAKKYIRIDHDEEDHIIRNTILAATHWVENYLEKSLIKQRFSYIWEVNEKNQPFDYYIIHLPYPPVIEIISVTDLIFRAFVNRYSCEIESDCPSVLVPRHCKRVEVIYDAGMTDNPDSIPKDITYALLMIVQSLYERRYDLKMLEEHPAKEILKCYKTRRIF